MTPPLGERLLNIPTAEETPQQKQMRAEIQEKLARLQELMNSVKLFPVSRRSGEEHERYRSPDHISGVVEYTIGKSDTTTKKLKAWLTAKDYGATARKSGTDRDTGEPLEIDYTQLYTRVELMTQAVINSSQTGLTGLNGLEKVRAIAMPPEDENSVPITLENLSDKEFSLYTLEEQLSMVNDALETVQLIANASPPNPRQPAGSLDVSGPAWTPPSDELLWNQAVDLEDYDMVKKITTRHQTTDVLTN